MVAATPSGITLAPEGGAHQSIATPLIGMAQDGLASFEPAFVDELAVIMGWGFQFMQREGAGEGGSVYLRLSTRTIDQPQRMMTPDLQKGITDGAYWLRRPGENCEAVIAYTGAVAPERRRSASWSRGPASSGMPFSSTSSFAWSARPAPTPSPRLARPVSRSGARRSRSPSICHGGDRCRSRGNPAPRRGAGSPHSPERCVTPASRIRAARLR